MRMRQYAPMFPRTALVTGGASGIGAAIVDLLRGEGAEVQALDLADGFDVSDAQAWDTVSAVELACLNAGVTTGEHDVTRLSDDAYRRILGANLDGVVFGVRRLATASWSREARSSRPRRWRDWFRRPRIRSTR